MLRSSYFDPDTNAISPPIPIFRPTDIIIAVVGITGSGKSTFVGKCSNINVDVGHNLDSCTKQVEVVTFQHNDQTIHLVDTPGFDDSVAGDIDILEDIAFFLTKMYRSTPRLLLSGVIYLHPIHTNRMTGTAIKNLRLFNRLVGADFLPSVFMVTTMWNSVTEATGLSRESEMIEQFWHNMIQQGCHVRRHDGSRESALDVCDLIVSKGRRVALKLQVELVDEGKRLVDTRAGQELAGALLAEQAKTLQQLQELKEEMRWTIAAQRQTATEEFKAEQARHEQQIKTLGAATERMRKNVHHLRQQRDRDHREEMWRIDRARERAHEEALRRAKADSEQADEMMGSIRKLANDLDERDRVRQREESSRKREEMERISRLREEFERAQEEAARRPTLREELERKQDEAERRLKLREEFEQKSEEASQRSPRRPSPRDRSPTPTDHDSNDTPIYHRDDASRSESLTNMRIQTGASVVGAVVSGLTLMTSCSVM